MIKTTTVNASDVKQAIVINQKVYASVEDAISSAKSSRSCGDMIRCLRIVMWLINNVSPVTGEMIRLAANTLIDLDMPNTAEHILSQFDNFTELDQFKNLDVLARIQYKKGIYTDAIKLLRQKMELSPKFSGPGDEKREYPTLLWFYTTNVDKNLALSTLFGMTAGKTLAELSVYELKAWAFYHWFFKEDIEDVRKPLIDNLLKKYNERWADNGPISFALYFLGYEDKEYLIKKFEEHMYFFESSIVNGLVPSKFHAMRGEALEILKGCDKGVLLLDAMRSAWYAEDIEVRLENGTLPL